MHSVSDVGKRGPAPKPTKLQLLEGNPGRRRINKNEVQPITPLRAPEVVLATPEADREWRRVVASMPPGFYTDADTPALTVYCLAWVMYRKALVETAQHGLTIKGSTGSTVRNPAASMAKEFGDQILRAAGHLGMSPAARTRMEAPEPIGESISVDHDPLDDLIKG